MPRTGLGPDELRTAILDAAVTVVRRHGAERTRLVDIAGLVGVHHSLLYRSFRDKAALMDALLEGQLAGLRAEIARGAGPGGPAVGRLKGWLRQVCRRMREWREAEPELFDLYGAAFAEGREVAANHGTRMQWQLAKLVSEAVQNGELNKADPFDVAGLLFDATALFHAPACRPAPETERPADRDEQRVARLLDILIAGLRAPGG